MGFRTPGPTCVTTEPTNDAGTLARGRTAAPGSLGLGANGTELHKKSIVTASRKRTPVMFAGPGAAAETFNVSIEFDYETFRAILEFSRPVTAEQASTYLFGAASRTDALESLEKWMGAYSTRYVLTSPDRAIIDSMRTEISQSVRDALTLGGQMRTSAQPYQAPAWVPDSILNDIKSGRLKYGVTRYQQQGDWGDIVVWKSEASIQIYQEFPEDREFYDDLAGNYVEARLLQSAYTEYNKEMKDFVETKGMPPEEAKAEIRRIWDEALKLVLEGAVAMLTTGAALTQVNNVIQQRSKQVIDAAKRSPRIKVVPDLTPVDGEINVGGWTEPGTGSYLNPCEGYYRRDVRKGIKNLIVGKMQEMDSIFKSGSAKKIYSVKVPAVVLEPWPRSASAAYRVMQSGGQLEMNLWANEMQRPKIIEAFIQAGFKDVKFAASPWGGGPNEVLDATGVFLLGRKP